MSFKQDARNAEVSYTYSMSLSNYLEEKLQLVRNKEKLKQAGKEPSEQDSKKKRANDRMKVHILSKHVFQSMANVIYFLEFVARNKWELQEVFEDDIEQLFFARKGKGEAAAFERLIEAAVTWNMEKDFNNYRVVLYHFMQNRIFNDLLTLCRLNKEFNDDDIIRYTIGKDMASALAWTKLYSRKVVEKKNPATRPLLF
jgi:hypothetical protein